MSARRFEVADFPLRIDVDGISDQSSNRFPNGTGFRSDRKHVVFFVTCGHIGTNKDAWSYRLLTGKRRPTELSAWFWRSDEPNRWLKAYYPLAEEVEDSCE